MYRTPELQQVSSSPSALSSANAGPDGESVGRRFSERKAFLEMMCRRVNLERKIFSKEFMDYNKNYRLLVCAPPKVSTNTLLLLVVMSILDIIGKMFSVLPPCSL